MIAAVAGALAGVATGYVPQRGQLCFHSAIRGSLDGRFSLARGWVLGVALASVGLALLFLLPGTGGLNQGLAFRPVANVVGALVGLAGWAVGELLARRLSLPGPTVLPGDEGATIPGVLGLPHLLVAVLVLAVVALALWRRPGRESPEHGWQRGWRGIGVGLGVVVTAGWALAALGGSSFGPSTVGAVTSVVDGAPNWWLAALLLGIVAAGTLAAGGLLLGAGGWIAGGCNLGHGLSGVARPNVSPLVVVASMVAGVWAARGLARRARAAPRSSSTGAPGRQR